MLRRQSEGAAIWVVSLELGTDDREMELSARPGHPYPPRKMSGVRLRRK